METRIEDQFVQLTDSIIGYLPNLIGGFLLILVGWLVGAIIKRVLIQFSQILRLDRLFKRSRWEAHLTRADVRHSISNFIGNLGHAGVFFIFVDHALVAWKLNILSDLIHRGILFVPRIIIAMVIFTAGWFLTSWVQGSILKSLHREKIPRAGLISKFARGVLLLFFSAIAFVELDIASEIVIIGFTAVFATLCILAIVLVAVGGKDFIKKIEESFRD